MKKHLLNWTNHFIKLNQSTLLNNQIINDNIDIFWDDKIINMPNDSHLLILFRVKLDNGTFITLGTCQRLNKDDKKYYKNYIQNILELKSSEYDFDNSPIISLAFSYGFREGNIDKKPEFNNLSNKVKSLTYYHYKLPLTFNPVEYGKIIKKNNDGFVVQINTTNIAIISVSNNKNRVEIYKSGDLVVNYVDTYVNEDKFIRQIGKNTYHVVNNKVELVTTQKSCSFIKNTNKAKTLNNKILTMDLETKLDSNNIMIPIGVSIFDGVRTSSFYLSDFNNSDDMLMYSIFSILKRKYHKHRVYIHNLSNFDAIFFIYNSYINIIFIVTVFILIKPEI